jgi:hypothetical protein
LSKRTRINPHARKRATLVLAAATAACVVCPIFGHDKIEGVATTDGGKTVYLANDSDFGLDHTNEAAGPYTLHQKTLPNGKADDGEVLAVDVSKLPLVLGTATVTIRY